MPTSVAASAPQACEMAVRWGMAVIGIQIRTNNARELSGQGPDQGQIGALWGRDGTNPLFELETGRMTEAAFLGALAGELTEQLGRTVELRDFGARYFEHLHPNEPMIAYMRSRSSRM